MPTSLQLCTGTTFSWHHISIYHGPMYICTHGWRLSSFCVSATNAINGFSWVSFSLIQNTTELNLTKFEMPSLWYVGSAVNRPLLINTEQNSALWVICIKHLGWIIQTTHTVSTPSIPGDSWQFFVYTHTCTCTWHALHWYTIFKTMLQWVSNSCDSSQGISLQWLKSSQVITERTQVTYLARANLSQE